MKITTIAVMLIAMTITISARTILDEGVRAAAATRRPQQDKRGTLFNFKKNQNALAEFNRIDRNIDAGLIGRIMHNSDFKGGRSELAHDLQNDDDMVRVIVLALQDIAANGSSALPCGHCTMVPAAFFSSTFLFDALR